jgi:hypothetical protein
MIWLAVLVLVFVLAGGGMWGWPLLAGVLGATSVKDKPSALEHIARLMREHNIVPAEVEVAFRAPEIVGNVNEPRSRGEMAKTLFIYLGAIFVVAGIGAYLSTFWNSMGSAMRVLATLGVGYLLLIVLISALYENKFPRLILPLTIASALVMTGGWFVLIHEVFPRGDNWRAAATAVFGVMAIHQGVLFGKYRRTVLAFTSLCFAYAFMQVGLDLVGVPIPYIAIALGASLLLVATSLEKTRYTVLAEPGVFIASVWFNAGLFDRVALFTSPSWASLIVGLCVMSTGYGLRQSHRYLRLAGVAYFAGSVMAYAGLFDLVHNSSIELLYLAATASMLYACLALQTRALLFTTVIAMLGFIGFYTAKHFANSLGWPITLVLMGVAFLAVGTLAIRVKRRI